MSSNYTQHAYGGDVAEVFYKYYVDGVSYADVSKKAFILSSPAKRYAETFSSGDEVADVVVAAFRSDAGASRQVLEAARARRFELLLSVPLMLEYESVLTRSEHLAASGASKEDVSAVLDEFAALVGKRVALEIRIRPMLSDPNDEMVLETAINGRADAIVTFNERDFRPVAARFRCSVLRPGEVVRKLAEETK